MVEVENEDFIEYLERYCSKHRVSPEVAKTHLVVQLVKQQYEGKN